MSKIGLSIINWLIWPSYRPNKGFDTPRAYHICQILSWFHHYLSAPDCANFVRTVSPLIALSRISSSFALCADAKWAYRSVILMSLGPKSSLMVVISAPSITNKMRKYVLDRGSEKQWSPCLKPGACALPHYWSILTEVLLNIVIFAVLTFTTSLLVERFYFSRLRWLLVPFFLLLWLSQFFYLARLI